MWRIHVFECFVLELGGQLGLADLAVEVALRVLDVERAHELLGDGRPALHGLAGLEVLDAGAHDRVEVDAAVLVEALVLDGDGGAPQVHRDVAPRDDAAQHVRLDEAEPRAVGRVDDRQLALVGGLQLVEVGSGGGDRQHVADRDEHGDDGDGGEHAEPEQHCAAPGVAPSPPRLSLTVGHREVRRRTTLRPRLRIVRAPAGGRSHRRAQLCGGLAALGGPGGPGRGAEPHALLVRLGHGYVDVPASSSRISSMALSRSVSGGSQTDTSTCTRGSTIVWFTTELWASRSFGTIRRRPSSSRMYV